MSEWQSATIVANGIQIHYTRTGGDKPPFVLAHGFSDDGLCWTPVAEQVAVDYDVIMADAAHWILTRPAAGFTGNFCIDDEIVARAGVTDLDRYAVEPGQPLQPDFFV